MPARRAITIAAGTGFTAIPCSIPAHHTRMQETSGLQLDWQSCIDAFATTLTTNSNIGNVIDIVGSGREGLLPALPKDFSASGTPAAAQNVAKVRTTASAGGTLIVEEYEGPAPER